MLLTCTQRLKECLFFLALMVASKRVPFNYKFMVTNHVQQLESTITDIKDKAHIVWPENLTGIKFDEIASKLHNKSMTNFNLTKCSVRRYIV